MPIDQRGQPANERLLYLVNRLARALNRGAEDVAANAGLTLPELMVVLVLGEGEGLSNAQLARRTFVSSQAGHQVAANLVERGLIGRLAHPSNRRLVVHELTPDGWAALEVCRDELEKLEARILDGLAPQDRGTLMPGLLKAAQVLRGGWFGDEVAEAASAERRASGARHAV